MSTYSRGEIEEAVLAYRSAMDSGRELTRAERDYLDDCLRPNYLDDDEADGELDFADCAFDDGERAYASFLTDEMRSGRQLSVAEAAFAEVCLRQQYLDRVDQEADEREHADERAVASADRELDRQIQIATGHWR